MSPGPDKYRRSPSLLVAKYLIRITAILKSNELRYEGK